MASLSRSDGKFTIQFIDVDGKRKSLRLGSVPKRTAEAIELRVEALLNAKITNTPVDRDRCPSELLPLTWDDVNWERGRFFIRSPKTEHHEGGDGRWVPIFPELRPYLSDAFDHAEPGTVFLINRYRSANANLRTQLQRICKRAGVDPWVKPFHNLRASRETELAALFPLHVVCEWIGNSATIAQKHYLQVTEADFERAAKSGAVDREALQNPLQTVSDGEGRETTQPPVSREISPLMSPQVLLRHDVTVPPVGIEPTTY